MNQYKGTQCPICGIPFSSEDDVVICPDCGAPYHRTCIAQKGACVFQDQHGPDFSWRPPGQEEKEKEFDGRGQLRCSRCGTLNPYGGLFCEVCGTPLTNNPGAQPGPDGQSPFGSQNTPPGFHSIPYNPFTTPFGGLNADEEIDGVPVKDLAIFVGESPHYFLPRFKLLKAQKTNSWNWSAVFLQFVYFVYRKMWGLAILDFLAIILLRLPLTLAMLLLPPGTLLLQHPLGIAAIVCNLLSAVLQLLLGLFFNRLYCNKVLKKVKRLQKSKNELPDYHQALAKKGSVARVPAAILLVLLFVLIVGASYSSILFGSV